MKESPRFRLLALSTALMLAAAAFARPHAVVIFYADDLGWGDTASYGGVEVPTPNLDALAAEGVRFTDAHSATSVCSPSRYSLLTGRYAFRRPNNRILDGDAKLILPVEGEGPLTLPSMMRKAGYRTAAIGKWHLGLGEGNAPTDWNRRISPGPNEVGFDYSYIMAATADRVPCVFLRNGTVVGLEKDDPIEISYSRDPKPLWPGEVTALTDPGLLKAWGRSSDAQHDKTIIDGISRIGHMRGGHAARWKDQEMADTLALEAERFLSESEGRDVFLYFCTSDIHVPRDPHMRHRGRSGLGIRGDATVQMDDTLGKVRSSLKAHGYEDALFIFTSDNGPAIGDGYLDGAVEEYSRKGVNPAGPFSGGKYTVMEGGTRVPMIVSWPGHTPKGAVSCALLSQTDFARSIAAIVGADIPDGSMGDSQELSRSLLGLDPKGRDELISEPGWGAWRGFRSGSWKLVTDGTQAMLFNLECDPGEKNDVSKLETPRTEELKTRLKGLMGRP